MNYNIAYKLLCRVYNLSTSSLIVLNNIIFTLNIAAMKTAEVIQNDMLKICSHLKSVYELDMYCCFMTTVLSLEGCSLHTNAFSKTF